MAHGQSQRAELRHAWRGNAALLLRAAVRREVGTEAHACDLSRLGGSRCRTSSPARSPSWSPAPRISSSSTGPDWCACSPPPRSSRSLSGIPTFEESGFAIRGNSWYAMYAPAKTPAAILDQYSGILAAGVNTPETQQRLIAMGFQPTGTTRSTSRRDSAGGLRILAADYQGVGILAATIEVTPSFNSSCPRSSSLVADIHVLNRESNRKTQMAGTSPDKPGHDVE